MAVFALSTQDFKSLVIQKQNLPTFQLPLPIRFVSEYLTHVESKRVQWPGKDGKVKPVSPSYYKAVVLSIKDLYMCEQSIMADDLSLLLFSKRKKFQREILLDSLSFRHSHNVGFGKLEVCAWLRLYVVFALLVLRLGFSWGSEEFIIMHLNIII